MFLYLEPLGGISGDMFLGVLAGLGVDPQEMFAPLEKAGLDFSWRFETVQRASMAAARIVIDAGHRHGPGGMHEHTNLDAVNRIVGVLEVPELVRKQIFSAFETLARVEAAAHGVDVADVHFHEVGAVDSIVDIAAGMLGYHLLGVSGVYCSPVPLGSGWVESSHGRLPVPAPATVGIMEGLPCALNDARPGELTTPTGALMLRALGAGPLPPASYVFRKTACGAGSRDPHEYPNVLRGSLLDIADSNTAAGEVVRLEAGIDDMSPEALAFLRERLEEAGALELGFIPQYMKKGRPGILAVILVESASAERLESVLFKHSTTLGIRWWPVWRNVLARRSIVVETEFGGVRMKEVLVEGVHRFSVEYEDAARLAVEKGVSLMDIEDAARRSLGLSGEDRQ
ncbi:MAG: nickel pincer cofactor biosynthesis protein LarC [Planctomycetes bacterium]|nr:nickel pincer cofactor biosynthesis protein LarC [Planctomycetota bacterium]